jgi:hypothetical protein
MGMFQTLVHEQRPLATGQIQTLQIPTGGKIQNLGLIFLTGAGAPVTEAQIRAEIASIRLSINGRDVINSPPAFLLDLYEASGTRVGVPAAVPGVMELNIGRLLFLDPVLRDLIGFGTRDVTSIQVQITCGTLSAIASAKTCTQRTPVNENLGTFCKFINYPRPFNAVGEDTYDTLPRNIGESYLGILVDDGTAGAITFGECRLNGQIVSDKHDTALSGLFASNKGFTQPAGYFFHCFADGSLNGQLGMTGATDFRIITTFGTAPGAGGYNISALSLVSPVTTA